jgi:succinoglycan biosynthesis protein ExoU
MDEICVIIAAMNAEATVGRAVGSALAEREVREVVVVDDASADATAHEAWSADDGSGRLKVLRSPRNLGPAAARNLALSRSSAPLIAVLDAHDVILPGRFAALADPQGDWDLSADNVMFIAEPQAEDFADLEAFATGGVADRMTFARFVAANLAQTGRPRGELGFLKPVMRRAFLTQHGLGYDARLRLGEDFDLYARMLLAGARFRLVAVCGYLAIERAVVRSASQAAAGLAALVEADERMLAGPLKAPERAALNAHRAQCTRRWHHWHFLDAKRRSGLMRALIQNRDRPRLLLDAGIGVACDKLAAARQSLSGAQPAQSLQPRLLVRP